MSAFDPKRHCLPCRSPGIGVLLAARQTKRDKSMPLITLARSDGLSFRRKRHFGHGLVQNDALKWVEISLPRGLLECLHGCAIARGPTRSDPLRAKIDILRMVFVTYARS